MAQRQGRPWITLQEVTWEAAVSTFPVASELALQKGIWGGLPRNSSSLHVHKTSRSESLGALS